MSVPLHELSSDFNFLVLLKLNVNPIVRSSVFEFNTGLVVPAAVGDAQCCAVPWGELLQKQTDNVSPTKPFLWQTWLAGTCNIALAPQAVVAASSLCLILTLWFTSVHTDFWLSWKHFSSCLWFFFWLCWRCRHANLSLFTSFASRCVKSFRLFFYCFVFHDWYFFVQFRLELPLLSLPGVTKLPLPFPAILLQAVPLTHRYNLRYSLRAPAPPCKSPGAVCAHDTVWCG